MPKGQTVILLDVLTEFSGSRCSQLSTIQPQEALCRRRKWCPGGRVRFSLKTTHHRTPRIACLLPVSGFLEKGIIWPGNSPDPNPVEYLCGILKQELDSAAPSTSVAKLTARLRATWANIPRSTLKRLVESVPQRVARCLALKGEYIGT